MDLLWPGFLLLLGLIPIIIGIYIWMLRRRQRFAVRFSSLALVRDAIPHQSRWRRHLPFGLFLIALASLIIAMGRPVSVAAVPTDQTTIILTIDVSRSMCSTDIPPSRLEAAEAAALSFIERQDSNTQIGIVAFSGFAELIQSPTTDTELLQAAVESLMTGRRTGIGSAILKSIDAIAEVDNNVQPSDSSIPSGIQPTPLPQGAFVPDIIILLTDGVSNTGPSPLDAAQQAADRGVRIYTIGFGTANGGSRPNCPQQFLGNEPFGGRMQFGGGGFRRGIDEATLQLIADMTGGTYSSAESASELQKVFRELPSYLITKYEVMEISAAFTILGVIMAATAIFLRMIWHPLS